MSDISSLVYDETLGLWYVRCADDALRESTVAAALVLNTFLGLERFTQGWYDEVDEEGPTTCVTVLNSRFHTVRAAMHTNEI